MYGAIEAGGTKFVCAIGNEDLEVIEQKSFPTTDPEETMQLVENFFKKYQNNIESIGVGSFGPIDVNENSETYGYITSTPKKYWKNFDFVGNLKKNFNLPIAWTTDVNAAAYGEYVNSYEEKNSTVVYFTIGTGVGGGAVQNGEFIQGFSHPEMGHMKIVSHSEDNYEGNCPYHANCLEGMAAGPAIEQRNGKKGQKIPVDDPFWDIEAYYIAQSAYNTTLMLSPDVIIFGGGVMQQEHLIEKVRKEFLTLMNNYVKIPRIEEYIVTPKLGQSAGIIGCLALAKKSSH